jgi:opacity protein-like surface antigen
VDTNIATEPPQTGCWWDPWWGYVCTTFQDTKTIDGFTYEVGLGARYDFNESFSLSGSYRKTWHDWDHADGAVDIDTAILSFGYKF